MLKKVMLSSIPLLNWIWRTRCRYLPGLGDRAGPSATAIVLSFNRPRNIEPIARALLKCHFVSRLLIWNNNPDVDINEWISLRDPRLETTNGDRVRGPDFRWQLATRESAEYFLVLDDDVFLFPEQLEVLFGHLVRDPDVPHGTSGTSFPRSGSTVAKHGQHLSNCERSVDVLHHVYAVTSAHISRSKRLFEALETNGISREHQLMSDDILISHCGLRRPRIHSVGPVARCTTSLTKGIAVSSRPGFRQVRRKMFGTIRSLSDNFANQDKLEKTTCSGT